MSYFDSVNSPEGQFPVAQRLSERSTTRDLVSFLMDFHASGAPYPRELICDEGRALLNAAVFTYSGYTNIEQYADALRQPDGIKTRIRMDVAHFKKKYKILLANVNRRVKCLYMAAIGQLLMTQNIKQAEEILEALFIISNCETEGLMANGEPTECMLKKTWLTDVVTGMIEYYNNKLIFFKLNGTF